MNFELGIKSYKNFPSDDKVYSCKFFDPNLIKNDIEDLSSMSYSGKNTDGDLEKDSAILDSCHIHAIETNSFYNGGKLAELMGDWIALTAQLKNYKRNIKYQVIKDMIVKYNDNLEKAKREYCATQLKDCIDKFNAAKHVKKAAYSETKTKKVCGQDVEYTVNHPAEYWSIPSSDYKSYGGKEVEKIAKVITDMESQSKISFINPSDWSTKINRKDDTNWTK